MNTILKLILKGIPTVFGKFFVALAGPTIRSLGLLRGDELGTLLGYVAALYKEQMPAYVVLGQYTVSEVEDLSESLHDTLVYLFSGYGVTLTNDEVSIALAAIGAQLLVKYPPPAK